MKSQMIFALLVASTAVLAQAPSARWITNAAYDDHNQHVLVYGGATATGIASDLWSLKGSVWRKISDHGPAVIKSACVYDSHRNRLVLFGGNGADDISRSETWEWDGSQWSKMDIQGPSPRNHVMGVYDKRHEYTLIFGGFGDHGALSDTWSYDGKSWKLLKTDGPKDYLPHGMIYDDVRKKPILVGVSLRDDPKAKKTNAMWEWSGNDWILIPNGQLATSPGSLQAIASSNSNMIVLFDGDDITNHNGKTWIFKSNGWEQLSIPGPSPRIGHVMVYNQSTRKTILFGGGNRKDLFNDVWEWDGQRWSAIAR